LAEIKLLGVRIAVDDFGTGYSSLAYLQRFPVDFLKIDRSFTSAITTSPESNALVGTLVQLGRDLGLVTLAEGVETTDQMDHLREEHVDQAQGYLLSRPLDVASIEAQILAPLRSSTAPNTGTPSGRVTLPTGRAESSASWYTCKRIGIARERDRKYIVCRPLVHA
jgi:sensor c-di-GMP phosphodiesterase-like protein